MQKRIVICGAAGRDFHDFNVVYRDDPNVRLIAFTAAQIPGIEGRTYPAELAGTYYPQGIRIVPEAGLAQLIRDERIDEVVFAYSDVTHEYVMHIASRALAAGADFTLAGPRATMLSSQLPVVAVSAVRTGCGKSQTARYLGRHLTTDGYRVAVIRHPMPYGDLARQAVQRFGSMADLDVAECSLEEREEYEPHIAAGCTVYAGVDYAKVLAAAELAADVVLWDGGNNDFPFVNPGLHIALVDALRPDQLSTHYPGETVLLSADVIVISKADTAGEQRVASALAGVRALVNDRPVIVASSPLTLDGGHRLAGARVLIVEDGPTITHGGMPHGAGYEAVRNIDAIDIIDPRPFAVGEIKTAYARHPHIGPVLPAVGYSDAQRTALRETIEAARPDVVVAGTPIDLQRALGLSSPVVRVHYEYADDGDPGLLALVREFLAR